MGLKERSSIIALAAGAIGLIGFFLPYIWIQVGPNVALTWSWGLAYISGLGIGFSVEIMIAGILIIIGAVIAIATGQLGRTREELKAMGIAWLIAGILMLVGSFIPMFFGLSMFLSVGFYLPLIGGIVAILAGVIVFAVK